MDEGVGFYSTNHEEETIFREKTTKQMVEMKVEFMTVNGTNVSKEICKKIACFIYDKGLWMFFDKETKLLACASGSVLVR